MSSEQWATAWSVTRALQTHWPMPTYIAPEALERGSCVHALTARIDSALDAAPRPDTPDIEGWVSAYRRFLTDLTPQFTGVEEPVESVDLDCHGIIDRIGCFDDGRRFVLDIKTGAKRPADAIQCAAYVSLLVPGEYDSVDRYGLYIRKDGSYRLRQYTNQYDFVTWLRVLETARRSAEGETHG